MKKHTHLVAIIIFIGAIAVAIALIRYQVYHSISIPVVTDYATSNEGLPVTATVTTSKGSIISARVASTQATQELGLSYFPSLPDNQGMLFTFSTPSVQKFWMKGMNFPLDIIWMKHTTGSRYSVVAIESNISPITYPQTFGPETPVDTVLEVNATQAAAHGITVGSSVDIKID